MPRLRIHFERSGIEEKLPLGPITEPKPGPTFEIEVAAPEIDVAAPEIEVTKSKPLKDKNAVSKKI